MDHDHVMVKVKNVFIFRQTQKGIVGILSAARINW